MSYQKRGFKFNWGFNCGFCGYPVDAKEQDFYYMIRDHERMDIPYRYACSLKCVNELILLTHEWNKEGIEDLSDDFM